MWRYSLGWPFCLISYISNVCLDLLSVADWFGSVRVGLRWWLPIQLLLWQVVWPPLITLGQGWEHWHQPVITLGQGNTHLNQPLITWGQGWEHTLKSTSGYMGPRLGTLKSACDYTIKDVWIIPSSGIWNYTLHVEHILRIMMNYGQHQWGIPSLFSIGKHYQWNTIPIFGLLKTFSLPLCFPYIIFYCYLFSLLICVREDNDSSL